MNRRNFLKGLGIGIPSVAIARSNPIDLKALKLIDMRPPYERMSMPLTPEELYASINKLFTNLGNSSKAWEDMPNGQRLEHVTYDKRWFGDRYPLESVAVRMLWCMAISHYHHNGFRQVMWRRNPRTDIVSDGNGDWRVNMRLSFA